MKILKQNLVCGEVFKISLGRNNEDQPKQTDQFTNFSLKTGISFTRILIETGHPLEALNKLSFQSCDVSKRFLP
mgnify:CR=1 FL=1